MSHTYNTLSQTSKKFGETNDCSVKAIAAVCRINYKSAWKLAARFGRKPRKGMSTFTIKMAVASKGLTLKTLKGHKMNKAKTIRTLKEQIPSRGVFLVFVRGHVLAIQGGEIHDWSEGCCRRIIEIVRVSKK